MNKSIKVNLKGANVQCVGKYNRETNKLTILSGSVIRKKVSPNFKFNAKRQAQIKEYCSEQKDSYVLNKDVVFETPSAAAKFSLGYEVNGPVYWKTDDNEKLKDVLQRIKQ